MEKGNIDFEILWKKINATLSPSEEEQFQKWYAEENHKEYFRKLSQLQTNPRFKSEISKEKAWDAINRLKSSGSDRSNVWIYTLAASVMLFATLFMWFKFESIGRNVQSLNEAREEQSIEPGSDKAYLITSTGTTVELAPELTTAIPEEKGSVTSHGDKLLYEYKISKEDLEFNTLVVPRGGKYSLVLSDSTKVWMNSESKLIYPVAFGSSTREVQLSGEAFFEVAKDSLRAFKVITNEYQITVLGTEFNVSAYQDEGETTATLVEGSLFVAVKGSSSSETMEPNDHLVFSKKTRELVKSQVEVDIHTAWKDDRFVFEGEYLNSILKTLSRWYNVEVFYDNEKARSVRFTGEIDRYQDFEKLLQLIEKTEAVKFIINGRNVIVE